MPSEFSDKTVVIGGDVAYFRCVMTTSNDDEVYGQITESVYKFQDSIDTLAREILGPEFEVRRVRVVRGSITILFALGTTYYVISKYKNFVESLELFKTQLATLMRRMLGPRNVEINVDWVPGPALSGIADVRRPIWLSENANLILLAYLIISHAALLIVVLVLFYKKFAP